jgi:trimethylamine--corrinoid protein Co-methyltransferase
MSNPIKRNIQFSVLDKKRIEAVHEKSLYLMDKVGMRIRGDHASECLKKHGIPVDSGGIAHISRKFVEKALKDVPKELKLYTREGKESMVINSGGNQCYFGTHSDQLEFVDPFENRVRPFLKKDIKTMCKTASALDNIFFVLSVGLTADVDPKIQTLSTFIETLRNFDKTTNFSTNDIESLQKCIDIAADFAGGLKNLQQKPFIFNYCEPIPPLTHPVESTEKLYVSAINRIPFVYMPYCMMGGTSPLSRIASLVQCNSEALTGLVLTQLFSEGAPFIYGAMPSIMDMRTTIGSYAAPEFHLNIAAMADIVSYYGIPFYGTAGCSDAKTVDVQAASEISYEVLSTVLSKANLIHDVGVMDHCLSVSPEAVVLANEVIESAKTYALGIEIPDDTLDVGLIEEAGHGGNYMTTDHTLENYREVWYPSLFSRKKDNPQESEVMGLIKKKMKFIVDEYEVPALDKERAAILDKHEKAL